MVNSQDLKVAPQPPITTKCSRRKQVLVKVNPNDFVDVEDTSAKESNPYDFFTSVSPKSTTNALCTAAASDDAVAGAVA